MSHLTDFNELSPLQKLKFIVKYDKNDEETKNIIKLVEKILHKELEIMLHDMRNDIKAGIFMSKKQCGMDLYGP